MRASTLILALIFAAGASTAQVPGLLHHQGRVLVGTVPFQGTGQFRFALVSADGSQVFWRNAADQNADGQPDQAVSLSVNRGLYSVLLGDPALPGMTAVPASVFTNSAVFLRTWFDDGSHGSQLLTPDQRVAPVGYAMMAATVANGAVGTDQLAPAVQTTLQDLATRVGAVSLGAMPVVSPLATDPSLSALGYVPFMNVPAPPWVNGTVSQLTPTPRVGHSALWTGTDLIVWGGQVGVSSYANSGARYRPATDDWVAMTTVTPPLGRTGHGAVWTGTEMYIWGGFGSGTYLANGGRYTVSPEAWTALPPGPPARSGHAMAWTGSRLLVWGGQNGGGLLNDGALYDPSNAVTPWSTLTTAAPPDPRYAAVSTWTGSRFLVWGGEGASALLGSGGQLIFSGATPQVWQAISLQDAPAARKGHTGVWTGSRWIIWGGQNSGGTLLGDGASYDPATDHWTPITAPDPPAARRDHSAVWTGQEMLILGGETASGATATGAAYDPAKNTWRVLTLSGGPVARSLATAAWTGTEALVFGGQAGAGYVAALQRLVPQPTWYFYRKP